MTPPPLAIRGRVLNFAQPVVMGIVNTTPDSFSDGGRFADPSTAIDHAQRLIRAGAQIIDVGGESTRPGSEGVSVEAELTRVLPVIEALHRAGVDAMLSIDTSKAEVARRALGAGAHLVNDVSALGDPEMAQVVATAGAGLILMHMRGEPRTMQDGEITYDDVVADVRRFLDDRMARAVGAGVPAEHILLDPGIGFGKTVEHNLALTQQLGALTHSGRPVVYGPSRKRFLGAITGREAGDRDRATAAACCAAILAGAHVLRVHDVGATVDAIRVAAALRNAPRAPP